MSDLISRETMKDAIDSTTWYHQNRNGVMVEGAPGVEDAWFKAEDAFKAIENVPTAQPNTPTDTPTDTISRQAAIDAVGINTWAGQRLLKVPSAHPEIIRCRDCENWDKTWTNDWSPEYHYCPMIDGVRKGDFYCADAKRRES